ncbi:hypothetical protein [Candidatus Deianiraea vastatrix]|uniref:Uncharacterized protein n=1 Tax=Candidatus Deianiraea vastatrix TaxID=2163644 RepID=A0A5B8XC20_9RICK|nr:hypothetical protein [Candidatus Deianiraea vastatrix]QED22899.1 hypothetical protein Deia_00085 [Candidatus Deianiraea vastatrix]
MKNSNLIILNQGFEESVKQGGRPVDVFLDGKYVTDNPENCFAEDVFLKVKNTPELKDISIVVSGIPRILSVTRASRPFTERGLVIQVTPRNNDNDNLLIVAQCNIKHYGKTYQDTYNKNSKNNGGTVEKVKITNDLNKWQQKEKDKKQKLQFQVK